MSDVRAGGAYVEIGAKLDKLAASLAAGDKMVKNFSAGVGGALGSAVSAGRELGATLESVGTKMMGAGAAMLAPLALATEKFAEYGEHVSNLAARTGVSQQALAGLGYAAKMTGTSMEAVAGGMKKMQAAIIGGSAQSSQAFAKLGIDARQLQGLSVEERFIKLGGAIGRIADPAEKAGIATALFGRQGMALIPMFERGEEGMRALIEEAKALGEVLDDETARKAGKLADGLHRMYGAFDGLRLAVGAAVEPLVGPFLSGIVDATLSVADWLKQNPELVQSFAKCAAMTFVAGAAVAALGAVIAAALSPVVMITAGVVAIGMAAMAVTDSLGITKTGFGELFNSIRVDGTGLGTWFTTFFLWLSKAWNEVTSDLHIAWKIVWLAVKEAVREPINYIMSMIEGVLNALKSMVKAANAIAPKSMQISMEGLNTAIRSTQLVRQGNEGDTKGDLHEIEDIKLARDKRNIQLEKQIQGAFAADPQDNTKGVDVDTSRMKNALGGIVDKMWDGLKGLTGDAFKGLGIKHHEFADSNKPEAGEGGVAAISSPKKYESVGTFSGFAGANIASSGVFKQQLETQKKIAENTGKLVEKGNSSAQGIQVG